jgi:hypothetical protein
MKLNLPHTKKKKKKQIGGKTSLGPSSYFVW